MVRCIKVPKSEGDMVRRRLKDSGLLNISYKIESNGDNIFIPIISNNFDNNYDVVDKELKPIEKKITDYRLLLPEEIRDYLPNSYDCIGDIIVVKMEDSVLPYKNKIGEALISVNKNVRSVFLDEGVKGELRIRSLERIAGFGETETKHKESGVTIMVDPSKVYFNPRLATERIRVSSLVQDGEIIIDMFAGVAPFPLVISKHSNPKTIYSIDLNHDAFVFMKKNIKLNKIKNIIPLEGDSIKVIESLPLVDRVIMNLPQIAWDFLSYALNKTKIGGIVHLYTIKEKDSIDEEINSLLKEMKSKGLDCHVERRIEMKTYSPSAAVYVFDIVRD